MPLTLLLALTSAAAASSSPPSPSVVIRDVTVIDAKAGRRSGMNVIVRGNRIAAVGGRESTSFSADTRVIDGRGKYLIPGLWDTHVHLVDIDEPAFSVLVAHGVTSVRDMGGDPLKLRGWKEKIAEKKIVGPRVKFCGPMLEGKWEQKPGERTDHWVVSTPAEAEATVQKLSDMGVDCVKMRTFANERTYLALAAAAKRHHLPLVGHAPWGLDPIEASDAGQMSFEHGFFPWPWTSLPADKKRSVGDTFRKNGSLVTPTLIAWQPFLFPYSTIQAVIDDTRGATDPRERTVSAALRRNWVSAFSDMKKWRGEKPSAASHDEWVKAMDDAYTEIREMHDQGVGVMVGTDTGATMVYPGTAVHQEMKLLVTKVGLRPIDAIIGATIIPAKHFGLEDSLGTIEEGKLADMVLLSADPLANIQNIQTVDTVILDGRVFDHEALNSLISESERRIAAENRK